MRTRGSSRHRHMARFAFAEWTCSLRQGFRPTHHARTANGAMMRCVLPLATWGCGKSSSTHEIPYVERCGVVHPIAAWRLDKYRRGWVSGFSRPLHPRSCNPPARLLSACQTVTVAAEGSGRSGPTWAQASRARRWIEGSRPVTASGAAGFQPRCRSDSPTGLMRSLLD